jgi:hypothetical protein
LEAIAVTETKKLIAQRDSVTKELGARDKNDEGALVDQLHEIKEALSGLEPFVTVAGSDVTVREGDFQARRKAHEAKQAAVAQEARCSSRFAYLDVGTEPDPKGLMACVESMRSLCREPKGLSVNQCELSLSRLEQNLREYAATQSDQLLKLKKAHDSLIGDDKKKNDDEQKALNERLADIRKLVVIPDEGDLTEYSDFKQWWSKFSFGYEYVSLNNAFSKGFPELGVTIGLNLPRQAVPDVSLHNWHFISYGVFTTFAAELTNTAEQTKTSLTTPSALDEGAKNALSVEEQVFWPWWRSDLDAQDRRLRTWLGPIFSAGGRKTDQDNFLSPRFYGGLRLARSPEFYSDFMFGRSSGLRSHRLEVRGQYPIFRFENRSRLILGAIGNFGVNKRKREAICIPDPDEPPLPVTRTCAEPDVIRFFLRYDITSDTLKKIFGGEK